MSKYIHNISEEAKTYEGREVAAGAFFLIEPSFEAEYMSCALLIADLANGIVKMSANGTSSISGNASANVDFLKGLDLTPKDSDGSPLSRNKVTQTGWNYQMHGFEFKSAQLDSFYSKKSDASDFGFGVLKCFKDSNGSLVECTDQADADTNAIVTQVEWEPTHDYEIVGGMLKQLSSPAQDLRVWVIGVPDVPEAYGGFKPFVVSVNLKFMGSEEGVKVDGRAPKKMLYDAVNHTNKLRLYFRHPAGFKHDMHMIVELFKA
jgi:predicted secreted protein